MKKYRPNDLKQHHSYLKVVNPDEFIEELVSMLRWHSIYELINVKEDEFVEYNCRDLLIPKMVKKKLQIEKEKLTLLDEAIKARDYLYKKYIALKKNNIVNSNDINEYFHFIGSQRKRHILFRGEEQDDWLPPAADYSEEIRQNIIGLLSGHIAILDRFIEIAQYVINPDVAFKNSFINMNDFLIQMVGFDKIETQLRKTLTTSKLNINEATYNYQIMNWDIVQLPRYQVNRLLGTIEQIEYNEFGMFANSSLEKEYAKEIRLIKTNVPLSERYRYLK